MRTALTRTAAILAATAAPLCIATAAPASAKPTGPITLTAAALPNTPFIQLTYSGHGALGDTCISRVQGAGAGGETIITKTQLILFFPTDVIVAPKTANLYAITYTCTGYFGPSSDNGSPLFVNFDGGPEDYTGPAGGATPFGS